MANSDWSLLLFGTIAAFRGTNPEPEVYRGIRGQITVTSDAFGTVRELEWHCYRSILDEHGQMSVTYLLFYPGRSTQGDIEAVFEIYNPEGTSFNLGDYSQVVVEYARFGSGEQRVVLPGGRTFVLPRSYSDNTIVPGYFTSRVNR